MPSAQARISVLHLPRRGETKVALIQQICTGYRARFFDKLSQKLAKKNFKLTVFFGRPQKGLTFSRIVPNPETLSEFSFNYKVMPRIAYEGKLPTSPFHFKRSFIFFPTLIFEIVHGKYDIIISDSVGDLLNVFPLFLITKLLLRKGYIVWCGGNIKDNLPKPQDSLLKKIAYVFARLIFRHYDAGIAYGPATKQFHAFLGADPHGIFVALNTVDTLYFEEVIETRKNEIEGLRRKLGIQGKKCVLYVGILEKRKKIEDLILAFKELRQSMEDTTLLLVGDGPHEKSLKDLCAREKIKDVHFLGKIDYGDVPLYYGLCDVFVLPSQGGIVVPEAMACGKPVIITEECNVLRSAPNLVKHGENGFILKAGDIDSLAQHMMKVLSDPVLAKSMGKKSKQMSEEHFSVEEMLTGFEQAIDYVVKRISSGH